MITNTLGSSFQYDILAVVPYPIFLIGTNGDIIHMNEHAERFHKLTYKPQKPSHISCIVDRYFQKRLKEVLERVVQEFEPIEVRLSFSSYPSKKYKVSFTPYRIHNETIIGMMVHNEKRKSFVLKKPLLKQHSDIQEELNNSKLEYENITTVPMHENGNIKGVYATTHNITKKKQIQQELIATKSLLESFIENTSDGILLIDENGLILHVNEAFEGLYGWKKEDVIGNDLLTIFQDYEEEVSELFHGVRNGKRFKGIETKRTKTNGTPFHVSLTMSPIKNEEGHIYGISSIIRDITDRKDTEELLRRSEKLAIIGQLAAGVAHEIRNPLTSLKGFLQLFHEMRITNKDILQVMMDEIIRIEMITNEFLSLAKPHVTKFEYHSINEIIQQVVKLGEIEGFLADVSIHTTLTPCLPTVYGDVNKLKQVFLNIVKNSIEAIDEKGVVNISTALKGNQVSTSFKDNGTGIEESRLNHLGEPFYSTKEKGTGLGLMVSRKIIEEHDGEMIITSEIGKGTTVEILLPACPAFQQQEGCSINLESTPKNNR